MSGLRSISCAGGSLIELGLSSYGVWQRFTIMPRYVLETHQHASDRRLRTRLKRSKDMGDIGFMKPSPTASPIEGRVVLDAHSAENL